jgi:putative membrane protein
MRSALVFSSLTAITLAFASPAFAQQPPAATPSQGTMPQAQMPAHTAAPGQAQKQKLGEADKNFAKEAALGGMLEVELGNVAQQNAQSDEVKQFGTRMVQDHSAANQELIRVLADKDFTAPQQLDDKHRKTLDRLSKMRGAEFDRAYMHEMVEDHDKDVKKFRQEAEHGKDADLKAFAQKTLPVLEQHQKMAHEINKSLAAVGSSGQAQGHKNR